MSFVIKLQQAWQSQQCRPLDLNPDQLLKATRLERRAHFWVDMFLIAVFVCVGIFMARPVYGDISRDWPWLITVATDVWVVGYILFNRWRQRRHAANYNESVLAHVEWAIKDIEHRAELERTQTLWYVLPIALGCMIPPVFFFAMEDLGRHLAASVAALVITEIVFAAVFYFVYWMLKNGGRIRREARRKELDALRALRESLLNEDARE